MSEETMQTASDPVNEIVAEQNISDAMSEKPVEETPTTENNVEEDKFAEKFAALSRKEKEMRLKQQEVDAKYAEYEAWKVEQKELANQKEPEVPLEYRLKKNPIETLAELGLSYDKLTELALNDGKLTSDMQMNLLKEEMESKYSKEIESIKNELLERDKKAEEARHEETIQGFMNNLTSFVNDNGENYELIRANDAVDLVYDVIESHHAETGRVLSNEEAANQVEAYLEQEAIKLYETNKLKSRFQKQAAPEAPQKTASPTLSNDLSAQVSTHGTKQLSDDESKAAIAALLKWDE